MLGSAFSGCSSPHRGFGTNGGSANADAGSGDSAGTGPRPEAGGVGRAGNGAAGRNDSGGTGGSSSLGGESGAAGDAAGASGEPDGCADDPCKNGATCVPHGSTFTCTCLTGYSGALCDRDIDDCASKPCQNAGTCADGIASYACTCPHGFSGTNCERVVHDCNDTPCLNGATCSNDANGYLCACKAGFTGNNCQTNIDDCSPNPCQNDSACVDGTAQYSCQCKPGYSGSKCETNINDCSPNPCLNGSTCTDGINTHTCACKTGYSGNNCQTNINDCSPNPCLNGGACSDGVNAYTCQCTGYTGAKCELPRYAGLGIPQAQAQGISADGKVIVGSIPGTSGYVPARWTLALGWKALSTNPGSVRAASSDGSTVVGHLEPGAGVGGAFRYTSAGFASLGLDTFSFPGGVSSDGNTIVGANGMQVPDLFRWTPTTGGSSYGSLGQGGSVRGVSADGTIAVGGWNPNGAALVPFRWSAAVGTKTLGTSAGSAEAISLDGSTIIGANTAGPFRYTSSGALVTLSLNTLTSTTASAINGDGSVIVGNSAQGPWIYDASHGARLVRNVLSGLGAATGECSLQVVGISSDGQTLVGNGGCLANAEGPWIARLN